jgi:2-succinyl-5-enolpyruvyl-6-hydroxy-3-cyclohexene-1-carboxylate synthase
VTVQATFAATLVDEWTRAGVTDAVIAPGSRSTPLAMALTADVRIRVHVHLDERSAAFFALGLGIGSGRPAVVLTTSGTAAVELHPAIVEAHHASVPLLAVTADRPPELIGVGAPQAIDQLHLFGGATRWSAAPGVPDEASSPTWRSLASRAVAEATSGPTGPGPVHLNLAFREPLLGEPDGLPPGRPDGAPWHDVLPARGGFVGQGPTRTSQNGVIVAGAGAGDPAAVLALAEASGWPVLADPLSGCRVPHPLVVAAFDGIVRAGAPEPAVVVRLGRPPASKALAQWLAASDADQWLVDPLGAWPDPDRGAARVIRADPAGACRVWAAGAERAPVAWAAWWQRAEAGAQRAIESVLDRHAEPTEPAVARAVTAAVPAGGVLVMSSSMPVRDVEWYSAPRDDIRVVANRGANGIDGVVSTALGVAAGSGRSTVALIGDLAFLHDVGGLLWATGRDVDCTLVVVDNDGGGIFSFLPQADALPADRFEQLFGTPHGIDVGALAAAYGVPVMALAGDGDDGTAGVRVVRVQTDRAANVAVHDELHAAIAAAVG